MTTIRYRILTAVDAPLLSEGIHRVYGASYPIPEFYDPEWICSNIAAGRLHSVVALDAGEVVACMSTVIEYPGDCTADGSALMVAEEYRGQGIVGQLGHHSADIYQSLGLGGLHLYALALHERVQKQSGNAGAMVTGCLPAWFSRSAKVTGYDYPDARIGAVPLYMPLGELPARVSYLPGSYADVLGKIYAALNMPRQLLKPDRQIETLPASTVYEDEHRPANGQLRVVVSRIGADLQNLLATLREKCSDKHYEVCYLDLPLADPAIDLAVRQARCAGLFFGALMVERGKSDRLRMQTYLPGSAAPESMELATDQARELQRYVLEDQAKLGNSFFQ